MDYEQGLPQNINTLPKYFVPFELFVCTTIGLLVLTIIALAIVVNWIYRVCMKVYNTDYLIDYIVNYEQAKSRRVIETNSNENEESGIKLSKIDEYLYWNRMESRMLEFVCISVVLALNICTHTCQAMEIAAFIVAIILFSVFNLGRVCERFQALRLLWFIPIIVCFISFYIFDKNLIDQSN